MRLIGILVFFVSLINISCGRAGPPKAPAPVVPANITDLTAVVQDGHVQLEWTIPTVDTKGRELRGLKTFEVYRREIPPFPPWEFSKDPEGWTPKGSLAPFKVHEGILRTVLREGNRAFMVSREGKPLIDATTTKYIRIRLRARNSLEGYFLFITEADKVWDLDINREYIPSVYTSFATYSSNLAPLKQKKFILADDPYFHEYTLDMSTVPAWTGNITQVGLLLVYSREPQPEETLTTELLSTKAREKKEKEKGRRGEEAKREITALSPPNGDREIEIDYIRTDQGKEPLATPYERPPWLFIEDEEGWSVQPVEGSPCCKLIPVGERQYENLQGSPGPSDSLVRATDQSPLQPIVFGAAKGFLYAKSQNTPIFLTSRDGIALDTSKFDQIEIRLKVSQGGEGYLMFQPENASQWDLDLQQQYVPAVYTSYNKEFSTLVTPHRIQFSIPHLNTYVIYRFNLSTLPGWTGKVRRIGLLFPPVKGEREVFIDYIQPLSSTSNLPVDGSMTFADKFSQDEDQKPDRDTETFPSSPSPGKTVSPKFLTMVSSSKESTTPSDQEIREAVLTKQASETDSGSTSTFVSYEALPEGKEKSLDPIKLAVIHLDRPEPARIEKGRVKFIDTGQLVHVELKDLIKKMIGDSERKQLPDIEVKPQAKYEYYVISTLGKRKLSDKSNLVTVQISRDPAPPSRVMAKADDGKVILQWQPVFFTKDGFKLRSLAGYNVYRSTTSGQYPDKPVNTTLLTDTEWTDAPLQNGQTYYYVIRTVSEPGNPPHESANSREVQATPRDLIPPAPPTGLSGTFLEDSVRLYWNPNRERDFIGYNIYRATPEEILLRKQSKSNLSLDLLALTFCKWYLPDARTGICRLLTPREDGYVQLNDEPFPQASYRDFNVERNKIYYYKVTAVDNASPPNESKDSNILEINTTPEE
ncbi:MAG TPA: hypothetical protein VNM22_21555 [Candidatus Limnocylindrales bacterium]|nr:hypothetical protein [Candidatus Limnocylindrales bacterium]